MSAWMMWLGSIPLVGMLFAVVLRMVKFYQRTESTRAMRLFRLRREGLEAKFFDLAVARGKPRGLRWVHCDWKNEVHFARDVENGLLTAFVGVDIYFEALEDGDMVDVEAVHEFREASAVFHYQGGIWGTGGKALFNLSPAHAVTRLAGQYEPVAL
ncbi:hypothetical protein [Planctomicrobium sp. SH664]|uniref:hypothetical protein n=1 Tax=Planctomicrobium sp. SH664 TaxID=3448125 RepID=UPI003F5BD8AF